MGSKIAKFRSFFEKNIDKEKTVLVCFYISFIFISFFVSSFLYEIYSSAIKIRFYNYEVNFNFLFIFAFTFLYIISVIISIIFLGKKFKVIKKNINFWILMAIFLSILSSFIAYNYISSQLPYEFPTVFSEHEIEKNVNVILNIINPKKNPYVLQDDTLCFNISMTNNKSYFINVLTKVNITSNNRLIKDSDFEFLFSLEPNETNTGEVCKEFTETGLNKFYILFRFEGNNISWDSPTLIFLPFIKVYPYDEYMNLIIKRNFSLLLSFILVPIVLSSTKILRDLYRDKEN